MFEIDPRKFENMLVPKIVKRYVESNTIFRKYIFVDESRYQILRHLEPDDGFFKRGIRNTYDDNIEVIADGNSCSIKSFLIQYKHNPLNFDLRRVIGYSLVNLSNFYEEVL